MRSEKPVSSDGSNEILEDETATLLKPLLVIRKSFIAFIVALGIGLVILGWIIDVAHTVFAQEAGVGLPISGIFGVLGVSIILFGFTIFVALKVIGYN